MTARVWHRRASQAASEIMQQLLEQVGDEPLLDRETEIALFRLVADERRLPIVRARARERLIMANTRLVARVALDRFGGQADAGGFSVEDAFMAGIEGLVKSVERFDVSRGFKFSTYATWWILQLIDRAVKNEASTIRLPIGKWDAGHRPPAVSSMDALAGEDGDLDRYDRADVDDLWRGPARDDTDAAVDRAFVAFAMRQLKDEREHLVVRLRAGLNGARPHTIREVAEIVGVSAQRVAQIEKRAHERIAAASGQLGSF